MSSAPGRTDVGWIAATTIQQVAAIAIVKKQISAAETIASRQAKLAERYLRISEELHGLWQSQYVCIEVKATNESCGEAYHTPQYEEQAGRYALSVKRQFQQAYEQLEQCLSPYCTGMRQLLTRDIAIEESRATADAVNYAYRYAEARAEALNDRRWAHMTQLIGLGRGLVTQGLSYAQAAGQLYSSLGNQAAASMAGAGKLLGYAFGRNYQNARPPKYNYQNQNGHQAPNQNAYNNNAYQGSQVRLGYGNTNISSEFSQASFNNVDSGYGAGKESYPVGGTGVGNVMGGGSGVGYGSGVGGFGIGTDFGFLGGAGVSGDK